MKFKVEYTLPKDGALEEITVEADNEFDVEDVLEDMFGSIDIITVEEV